MDLDEHQWKVGVGGKTNVQMHNSLKGYPCFKIMVLHENCPFSKGWISWSGGISDRRGHCLTSVLKQEPWLLGLFEGIRGPVLSLEVVGILTCCDPGAGSHRHSRPLLPTYALPELCANFSQTHSPPPTYIKTSATCLHFWFLLTGQLLLTPLVWWYINRH